MSISYNRLWKLLIDKGMKKTDLKNLVGISPVTLAKLGRNENINTEVISRICAALECQPSDIMEFIPENKQL